MAKVKTQKFTAEEKEKFVKNLGATILKYDKPDKMEKFLRDFLTPSEIIMLARRIQIADGLIKGKGYRELHEKYGIGMSTVQLVDKWLRVTVEDYKYAPPGKRDKKQKKTRGYSRRSGIQLFLSYSTGPNPYFIWQS
ncbi:MAG: Trp family transcriptional regulator [bacterium]|nr:Trp family transcriptional regulator [bacterium]